MYKRIHACTYVYNGYLIGTVVDGLEGLEGVEEGMYENEGDMGLDSDGICAALRNRDEKRRTHAMKAIDQSNYRPMKSERDRRDQCVSRGCSHTVRH